jgi:Holin of 3TMs, for gene-transfer release
MALPLIGSLVDLAGKIIDRVVPDPKAKSDALLELAKLEQSGDLAAMAQQVEINKIEAASNDPFQRRWRPFIGWVCGGALAVQLVIGPLVAYGCEAVGYPIKLPVMQTELLTTLLVSMLGLGGMRTVEKLNGKQ